MRIRLHRQVSGGYVSCLWSPGVELYQQKDWSAGPTRLWLGGIQCVHLHCITASRKLIYHIEAETNGRCFADDIFKWIFLNKSVWIPIRISLKFVPNGPINKIPALVQIMAWRRPGDKPLSEPIMVSLPTIICVIRPQWDICTAIL